MHTSYFSLIIHFVLDAYNKELTTHTSYLSLILHSLLDDYNKELRSIYSILELIQTPINVKL